MCLNMSVNIFVNMSENISVNNFRWKEGPTPADLVSFLVGFLQGIIQ
jgi:hypothetical protein